MSSRLYSTSRPLKCSPTEQLEQAQRELDSARTRMADGLLDEQRALAETQFTAITEENLADITNIERQQSDSVQEHIDKLNACNARVYSQSAGLM